MTIVRAWKVRSGILIWACLIFAVRGIRPSFAPDDQPTRVGGEERGGEEGGGKGDGPGHSSGNGVPNFPSTPLCVERVHKARVRLVAGEEGKKRKGKKERESKW